MFECLSCLNISICGVKEVTIVISFKTFTTLEKQSLQSEISSTKMRGEQELHALTMQNKRALEEMQAQQQGEKTAA